MVSPYAFAVAAEIGPPAFVCSWTDGGWDAVWMSAAGELDIATVPRLERVLRLPELQVGLVVPDLRGLTFTDCSGVHAIVNASMDTKKAGHRLVVPRGAPTVEGMLRLTGSSDDVEISEVEPAGEALPELFQRDTAR